MSETTTPIDVQEDPARIGIKLLQDQGGPALLETSRDVMYEKTKYLHERLQTLMTICAEEGIVVDRSLQFSGELIIYATSEQKKRITEITKKLGWLETVQPRPFANASPSRKHSSNH